MLMGWVWTLVSQANVGFQFHYSTAAAKEDLGNAPGSVAFQSIYKSAGHSFLQLALLA